VQMSNAGLDMLRQFEGLRTSVYKDVVGLETIGYGHRVLPGESFPTGITREPADQILAHDVALAEATVNQLVSVEMSQGQFDALVDFVFNLGPRSLSSSTLLKELNDGQTADAGKQILRWDHAGGVEVAGLTRRREAEYMLWTGQPPAPGIT